MNERRPRGRGRPAGKNPPPHFPDGCVIHLFDSYPEAAVFFGSPPTFRHYGRGEVSWFCVSDDPDWLLGVEPARFVDHTSTPWPPAMREMVEWRATRANAPILRHIV